MTDGMPLSEPAAIRQACLDIHAAAMELFDDIADGDTITDPAPLDRIAERQRFIVAEVTGDARTRLMRRFLGRSVAGEEQT